MICLLQFVCCQLLEQTVLPLLSLHQSAAYQVSHMAHSNYTSARCSPPIVSTYCPASLTVTHSMIEFPSDARRCGRIVAHLSETLSNVPSSFPDKLFFFPVQCSFSWSPIHFLFCFFEFIFCRLFVAHPYASHDHSSLSSFDFLCGETLSSSWSSRCNATHICSSIRVCSC